MGSPQGDPITLTETKKKFGENNLATATLSASKLKRTKKLKVSHNVSFLSSLPWIGPALFLIVLVVIWPVVILGRTSFTDISPIRNCAQIRYTCSSIVMDVSPI